MQISRRDLFRSTAAVGGVAALSGLTGGLAASAVAGTVARATTLTTKLGKGEPGTGGYRPIIELPGETHRVRRELAKPKKGRAGRRKPVLAFAQLSDVHIMDSQSPIRLEGYDEGVSSSAYRPQEILGGHVADAMVREINAIGTGPVTGAPLAFAIQTGDNSDTTQFNEIRWNIDILDGGTVRIDSGDLTKYEGVMDQDPTTYNTMFWHPDGTPEGLADDRHRAEFGFPVIEGLLDAARQPFEAEGLAMEWYAAMGNHDGLVQGNFPATAADEAKAIGSVKTFKVGTKDVKRDVTPDPDRRLLDRAEWIAEHFTTTGLPVGHGFKAENQAKNTAYYTFDKGKVRFVVLDSVADFGDKGEMDQMQFTWLKKVLDNSTKKLVVLASHHPLASWQDPTMEARITKLLVGRPNVIAWVNGHTHRNQIWAHPRKKKVGGKKKVVGGFWEINTASHIDWPQQSRLIEIADNKDGTISIFTTMVDHGGSLAFNGDLTDPVQLAGLSRELGANDWQERSDARDGKVSARNVELLLPAPAFLR